MKSAEHEIIELALKKASPAHQKVGWVKIFNKVLVPVQKVFSFKARHLAFAFLFIHCIVILSEAKNPVISALDPSISCYALHSG